MQEEQLGHYAGDDDCGLKEEDVGVVDLADAGVKFLVHGHQVLLVCNTWNGGSRTRVVGTWEQKYSLIPRLKYSLGMRLMLMQVEKLYVTCFVASHIKLSFLKLVGLRIYQATV